MRYRYPVPSVEAVLGKGTIRKPKGEGLKSFPFRLSCLWQLPGRFLCASLPGTFFPYPALPAVLPGLAISCTRFVVCRIGPSLRTVAGGTVSPSGRVRSLQRVDDISLLLRGVPDLCLPVARNGKHGLYVEMKWQNNKTTEKQDWWLEQLRQQGYETAVCWSAEEAMDTIAGYLGVMEQTRRKVEL